MKTIVRILLGITTMLFLYKVISMLYEPFTVDRMDDIYVRKYAWIVSAAVAASLVFLEGKLHLITPKPVLGERCMRRDRIVAIILTIIAVVHVLSAFLMPNIAEIFSPIFLVAALLEQVDFLEAALDFLNKNFFMLEGMYHLFDVFIVQQVIFSAVCYVLFGKLYRRWQARQLQTIEC